MAALRGQKSYVIEQYTKRNPISWISHMLRVQTLTPSVCVDCARFKTQPSKKDPRTLQLLTVTKYQARKNNETLVEALAAMQKLYPQIDFYLTIVSSGGVASQKKRLRQLVHDRGLVSTIQIMEEVPATEMLAIYHAHNIFILGSAKEPLGYSALEAMACSMPILVSKNAGAAIYIPDAHKPALVITPGSVNDIVKRLSSYIKKNQVDVDTLSQTGDQLRSHICATTSSAVVTTKLRALFAQDTPL